MAVFLQLLVYGIVLGSIITLGAVGLSLLFGILRFPHFAHGDLMTVGAYLALLGVAGFDWPMWLAFGPALVGTVLVAIAIDRTLYRPLRRTAPVILLISSVGVALILRSAVQIVWGADNHVYASGIKMPLIFADIRIQHDQVAIVIGALLLVGCLHLFLQRTKMGKAMRAVSDNMDLARVSGIDTERVVHWTWVIGGAMAAAAGIFLGIDTRVNPNMGWHLLLPLFAAAILGGIGRPYGAILGGYVIGIATELSTVFLLPAYKPAVAFAVMVLLLIFRPWGLFAGAR